jgi:hypothetical protein
MDSAARVASGSLAVVGTAALAAYFVVVSHLYSEWNWLWILGPPLGVTVVLVRRSKPWVWTATFAWLAICSFVAFMLTTQVLGLGT